MSPRLPLIALAASAFAIGTTEFVVMGLLQQMAADLRVSIPAAGLLVSGYAMGVVVGGPLLAMATARLPRKTVLLVLMAVSCSHRLFAPASSQAPSVQRPLEQSVFVPQAAPNAPLPHWFAALHPAPTQHTAL